SGEAFADVAGDAYYADAVIWASANGIVTGTGENSFAPGDDITREQLATILYRYTGALGSDARENGSITAFADADEVSAWAEDALGWAAAIGLIQGRGDNTLAPKAAATRAETAAILERFLESLL
ncbi:MAG: S-layer homology domain-containing protein, partial [Clostridiales Family XIII bacterium]|nr:S-layer homology domain-containing protein [Clostridiales Family XIII bacterium]